MRVRTDKILSMWWAVLPIAQIGFSVSLLVYFFTSFFGSITTSATGTPLASFQYFGYYEAPSVVLAILYLYLIFELIKRRNEHFERQNRVFYDAFYVLRQAIISRKGQLSAMESGDFSRIDGVLATMRYLEAPKSALLWVVLLFVPIVDIFAYFYIYCFLMRDFFEHERNEDYLVSMFSYISNGLGIERLKERDKKVGDHSSVVFIILTIFTFGLFGIYWLYLLIKEPNVHFIGDASIEAEMVTAISTLAQAQTKP
jgi:hypothetical protein